MIIGIITYNVYENMRGCHDVGEGIGVLSGFAGGIAALVFGFLFLACYLDDKNDISTIEDYQEELERYKVCPDELSCVSKVEIKQKVRRLNRELKMAQKDLNHWFWASATPDKALETEPLCAEFLGDCSETAPVSEESAF
jgi:hypothetical protein